MRFTACLRHGSWLISIGFAVLSVRFAQADWPQFLGPGRNSVAESAKGLPRSWPKGGPKVLWRIPVGDGFGGAAIYGDSVVLLDRNGVRGDIIRRLRLADGKDVWSRAYDAPGKLSHHGSRTTPAVDGKYVYTVGPFGHVYAVRFSNGTIVWRTNLIDEWGAKLPTWGVSTSPLLLGKYVIITPWGTRAAVIAIDRARGKLAWATPNPKGIALDYSSPVPMKLGRAAMVVASGKKGYTIGVDANTGRPLWFYGAYRCSIHVPSPMILDNGRILITGGYGGGSVMIQVVATSRGYAVREMWKNPRLGSTLVQPVAYKNFIYINKGFKSSQHGMACLALNGRVMWDTGRSPSFDMGPLLLADGLIFALDGKTGDLVMVEPNPKGYKELGRTRFLRGPQVWAPIAYSNGKLVLRDRTTLVCVELSKGAKKSTRPRRRFRRRRR